MRTGQPEYWIYPQSIEERSGIDKAVLGAQSPSDSGISRRTAGGCGVPHQTLRAKAHRKDGPEFRAGNRAAGCETGAREPGKLAQRSGRIIHITTSFFTMLRAGFHPYGPCKAGT